MKYKKILTTVVAIIFIVYVIMLSDTNSVINDFKSCVKCNNIADEILNTKLYQYYFDDFGGIVAYADVRATRKLVLHNFKKGVIWLNYTYYAYDNEGKNVKGSHNIDSKWYIKKIDGRWIVYDIEEAP